MIYAFGKRGNIMKKKFVCVLVAITCLMFSACNAEDINSAVNAVGEDIGVDINLNLEQEQVDAVVDKAEEIKDGVVNVITDESVKDAAGGLLDAIKDAVNKESNQQEEITESASGESAQ